MKIECYLSCNIISARSPSRSKRGHIRL